jgi:isopentenyl diphosphate isomerase/L-lactate dehydrogenase-like FMN-dependent dehydrogenase
MFSVDDFRRAARKRLPRIVFDFLEGGALDEATLRLNVDDLAQVLLRQRVFRDVAEVDLAIELFGRRYDAPIAIAPMGLLSIFRPDADIALARAAQAAGTFFVHSAWSGTPLESVAAAAPGSVWAQLALWPDPALVDQHLERAARAGVQALVVAADVAMSSKRDRDLRNGFTMAGRPAVRGVVEALRHPRWVSRFVFGPRITFGDQSVDGRPMTLAEMSSFMDDENAGATWVDLAKIRQQWKGTLVVKGIMDADDARAALDAGADGVYVSNHGGRQFDGQPSTVAVLPRIADAVNGLAPILVDGGVRRGADVVRMRALGADVALIGRPAVYGAVQSGVDGATEVLDLLRDELAVAAAFIGASSYRSIGTDAVATNPLTTR